MEQIGTINTGQGFGAIKNHPFVKENKEFYENYNFLDKSGNFKKIICVPVTTKILIDKGMKVENSFQKVYKMNIYPVEFFCPKILGTNKLNITKNTYSIHHFESSWKSNNRLIRKIGYYIIPIKKVIKKIINNKK